MFLGDIAQKLGITQPSCSRIIHDLIAIEYIEQQGLKKCFISGQLHENRLKFGMMLTLLMNCLKCWQKIQKEKFVLSFGIPIATMAYPIYQKSKAVAVLGSSLHLTNFSGSNREFILSELSNTAERVNEKLNGK